MITSPYNCPLIDNSSQLLNIAYDKTQQKYPHRLNQAVTWWSWGGTSKKCPNHLVNEALRVQLRKCKCNIVKGMMRVIVDGDLSVDETTEDALMMENLLEHAKH